MVPLQRQRTVNLIVAHPDDAAVQQAFARMGELVRSAAVDPLLHVWMGEGSTLPQALIIGGDDEVKNLTELLADIRTLERVRIVGLFCSSTAADHADEINSWLGEVKSVITETKGASTEVAEVRVQAISNDVPQVSVEAFSGLALANIVLIPHDRRSDTAAARLIESNQTERFAAHIAVEVCSLLGAWTSMKETFLDNWTYRPPGGGGPSVIFLRSTVRSLVCPPLPLDRIVGNRRLPMPQGCLPSPNPEATVRAVADAVFPDELRFKPHAEPQQVANISLGEAMREIPRAVWKTVRSFPRVFRDGLSRDLESLQGDGLQDLIGGEAAWLQIDYRDRQSGSDTRSWAELASEAIEDLERQDEMPTLVGLTDETWSRLVELPLAIVDGSSEADDALDATGERRYLVADPMAFAGGHYADNEDAIVGLLTTLEASQPQNAASTTEPSDPYTTVVEWSVGQEDVLPSEPSEQLGEEDDA